MENIKDDRILNEEIRSSFKWKKKIRGKFIKGIDFLFIIENKNIRFQKSIFGGWLWEHYISKTTKKKKIGRVGLNPNPTRKKYKSKTQTRPGQSLQFGRVERVQKDEIVMEVQTSMWKNLKGKGTNKTTQFYQNKNDPQIPKIGKICHPLIMYHSLGKSRWFGWSKQQEPQQKAKQLSISIL